MASIPPILSPIFFPDNVLKRVLSFLSSQADLCAICLTNRRFNTLADPLFHRDVQFEEPKRLAKFYESFSTRPRRGSLVKKVRVEIPDSELSEYWSPNESKYPIDRFSHCISTMTYLVNLIVVVPELLSLGIGDVFNGPCDLAYLESCTLYYQSENGGYWNLKSNIHVFSHPTLQNLTIRHARLDENEFGPYEIPEKTGLHKLQLIECDIAMYALFDIFLIPKALKEITIKQLEHPQPPLEKSSILLEEYLLIIRLAKNSLERMIIDLASLKGKEPMRMYHFTQLTYLELRDYQLFGQATTPHLSLVDLPPKLEILKFLDRVGEDDDTAELLCSLIKSKSLLTPLWSRMIIEDSGHLPSNVMKACEEYDGFLA